MNHHISHPPNIPNLHYRVNINQILGKGFSCVVYKGVNIVTNQSVAIKQVNLLNANRMLAFNQIECLRLIHHQNVLAYRYHYRINHFSYLVTQLCQYTLHEKIKRNGRIEEKQALNIFIDLLNAYQQVRKVGFLHRDLKPQNIFFKGNQVKIGDFGFCIRLRHQQMKDIQNVGSPLYMSPQALEHSIYSQKSDVWSLGLILYQMIHGNNPFTSNNERNLLYEIKRPILHFNCHENLINIFKQIFVQNRQYRLSAKQLRRLIQQHVFSQQTSKKQITKATNINNQINYLKLMEYVKMISCRCPNNLHNQRIQYLFQFNIRMRINFLQAHSIVVDSNQLSDLNQRHSFDIKLPEILTQDDRLLFFHTGSTIFNIQLLWQTQAQLKDLIIPLLSMLTQIDCEQKVPIWQQELRLTDYLLTAFVLNRTLIQTDNDSSSFQDLSIILSRPHRFSLAVSKSILQKGKQLRII